MLRPMFLLSLAALTVSAVLRASISPAVADVAPISAVMGSINIEPGQVAGDVSDVNGSIHIGEHATVANVGGVNGSIHIAQGASAGSLHTVNGSIHVGPGAHIAKTINTVNGSIAVDSGTDVQGSVWTVNGAMTLTGASAVLRRPACRGTLATQRNVRLALSRSSVAAIRTFALP